MWKTTYNHCYIPDVKCGRHTTSPLVTSDGTQCEKSILNDVKCYFCSSVSIFRNVVYIHFKFNTVTLEDFE